MPASPGPHALADYHVHTARCGHAVGAMERYVEQAIAAGLSEIGFSDHLYLYWLPRPLRQRDLAMADWELDYYVEDVARCQARYGSDITIRLSTEADFVPGHERELEAVLRRYDWDYVIGSIHFIGAWGFDDDRNLAGYERWDNDALYAHYFDLMAQAAETGLFTTMGHVDLVKKFGHRPTVDQTPNYQRLAERFARAGVCVELNTSGLRKPCAETYPSLALLRACRAAGVPTTFASDAHQPDHVAADFAHAVALMRAAGYKHYLAFRAGQREEIDLPAVDPSAAQKSNLP